jgi:N-methylhydantoinase B
MLARQRQDHARVLRETAIADDGVVLTGKLDHDLLSHDAAATDVKRAPRPARAEVFFGRGPGYVLLSGGAFFADVNRVAP